MVHPPLDDEPASVPDELDEVEGTQVPVPSQNPPGQGAPMVWGL